MRKYDTAALIDDGSTEIREVGNNVLIPRQLFFSATPYEIGDCVIYHTIELQDRTKFAATLLK